MKLPIEETAADADPETAPEDEALACLQGSATQKQEEAVGDLVQPLGAGDEVLVSRTGRCAGSVAVKLGRHRFGSGPVITRGDSWIFGSTALSTRLSPQNVRPMSRNM